MCRVCHSSIHPFLSCRHDPSTWDDISWLGDLATGAIHSMAVGHSEVMWAVRTHHLTQKAFQSVWGVEGGELLTSFDGLGLYRPWHREGAGHWKTKGGWWHIDQDARKKPGFECVQVRSGGG